ncbi:MAG: hypothetical protein JNL64_15920, partial [Blastocatellia bacterium]|nr:hypothetical protein [Blastocatellia bacterium]
VGLAVLNELTDARFKEAHERIAFRGYQHQLRLWVANDSLHFFDVIFDRGVIPQLRP